MADDRRAAVPAGPRPGRPSRSALRHRRAEPRLAGSLRGARRHPAPADGAAATGSRRRWDGLPPPARRAGSCTRPTRHLGLPAPTDGTAAAAAARRAVPHPAPRRRPGTAWSATTRCPPHPPTSVPASASSAKPDGVGSGYLDDRARGGPGPGRRGEPARRVRPRRRGHPVVLLSAGIGVTPVLAMLHDARRGSTASGRCGGSAPHGPRPSTRWPRRRTTWCPACLTVPSGCSTARSTTRTSSRPPSRGGCRDRLARLGLPTDATAYLCGPERFMADVRAGLLASGWRPRGSAPSCSVADGDQPRRRGRAVRAPHPPAVPGGGPLVTFARSGLSVPYDTARTACWRWPTRATSRRAGPAAPACATPVDATAGRRGGLRARSAGAGGGRGGAAVLLPPGRRRRAGPVRRGAAVARRREPRAPSTTLGGAPKGPLD